MYDVGSGPPLVLVPGIQGRIEWMSPTVHALASRFRVLAGSFAEHAGRGPSSPDAAASAMIDRYVEQIGTMLDGRGISRAAVVGVSFGGIVALRMAATQPTRVDTLVLASTPGPHWKPDPRARRYLRAPLAMAPAFVLGAPWRLGPEIVAAYDDVGARLRFAAGQAWRVVRAPMRIGPMAARLRLLASVRTADWCALVEAPTLVITGEPRLDRVVPVAGTREYAAAIRGARSAVLPRTGHIGSVTRPEEFAEAVWRFVSSCRRGQDAEGAGS